MSSHHIVDTGDLKAKLAEAGNKLVVIDFFAEWCGPCQAIAPKFETMAAEMNDVIFLKVDVDKCKDIADEYKVIQMPTFVFVKGGKQVDEFAGACEKKIKELINKHTN